MTESTPESPNSPHQPTAEEISVLAQFATLGMSIAGTVSAGIVLGLVFDHFAHSAPIGLFAGLALGSVGAVSAVVTLIRRWM